MVSKALKKTDDLQTLELITQIKIWGNKLDDIYDIRFYKGKFVMTDDGKFIAKILPRNEYDKADIFHNTMLSDLGIKNPDSAEIKRAITGGGKIEVEMIEDYVECRLYDTSQTYGPYNKDDIDTAEMESAIEATFHLGMLPILVIPDFRYAK